MVELLRRKGLGVVVEEAAAAVVRMMGWRANGAMVRCLQAAALAGRREVVARWMRLSSLESWREDLVGGGREACWVVVGSVGQRYRHVYVLF